MSMLVDRETLTMEELEMLIERAHLTPQQAAFVKHGVSSGDWKFAATVAYQMKRGTTAQKAASSLMRRRPVREVLDAYYKKSPREILLDDLDYARNNPTKLRAVQLKAMLLGVRLDAPVPEAKRESKTPEAPTAQERESEPPKAVSTGRKVGAIIEQDGVRYEILALDADGEPAKVRDVATGKVYPEEEKS